MIKDKYTVKQREAIKVKVFNKEREKVYDEVAI